MTKKQLQKTIDLVAFIAVTDWTTDCFFLQNLNNNITAIYKLYLN